MINGFISYKYILSKIYRDLNLNEEINESSVIEWIAEGLAVIGAFSQYTIVPYCVHLKNGKGALPCGFSKLVDISYQGFPVYWATEGANTRYGCEDNHIPICRNQQCTHTFYVNDNFIITNINNHQNEEAKLNITYLGIPVDEEGFPMLPDDVYYQKALAAYITYMLTYQDWRRGKATDKVFEYSEREWIFYCNSARGAGNMPNTQQLENLKNVIRRLSPMSNDYKRNFNNFNKGEQFNLST